MLKALSELAAVAGLLFVAAVAVTYGVAVTCRALNWSPINITVNIGDTE